MLLVLKRIEAPPWSSATRPGARLRGPDNVAATLTQRFAPNL
jgi:hypothetical protein